MGVFLALVMLGVEALPDLADWVIVAFAAGSLVGVALEGIRRRASHRGRRRGPTPT